MKKSELEKLVKSMVEEAKHKKGPREINKSVLKLVFRSLSNDFKTLADEVATYDDQDFDQLKSMLEKKATAINDIVDDL
jgi:hypothetical protein